MALEVNGIEELKKLFEEHLPSEAKKAMRMAAKEGAKIVAADAKAKVPRDTGALRQSIRVRAIKRSRVKVGSRVVTGEGFFKGDTYYGGFVEYGTHKMKAQPFLRPAADENRERVIREFGKFLRASIQTVRKRTARSARRRLRKKRING